MLCLAITNVNIYFQNGLARIHGLHDDDLFLNVDADELIKPEVIQFLRLYDGYPELIWINFRWTWYAYFWQSIERNQIAMWPRKYFHMLHSVIIITLNSLSFNKTEYRRTSFLSLESNSKLV